MRYMRETLSTYAYAYVQVSVALVDCEGCLPSVMHILKRPSVRALILEEDAAPTSYLLPPTSYLLPPTSYLLPTT